MMARYAFVVETGISMSIELDADSLEDAVKQAQEASVRSLCSQCSSADDGQWGTSEFDCEPSMGKLVDAYVDDEEIGLDDIEW